MSFLAPVLLFGLPLAALPVIIHLIHLHRRRTVPWAAMMFLLMAQKMNRGFSKLRQFLILAARVLAVLALVFVISRPLAGGWLGLTGGAPDTVLVLLDRSASMEQQNLTTGISKRASALTKMSEGIEDMFGSRTKVVLIDSASNAPIEIANVKALTDVPVTSGTDTGADLPAMLQAALDYITANQLGRTDIWIASDLRQADWNATSGRWEALRAAFGKLEAVRFHLLAYPQSSPDNLSVQVENFVRRETAEKAELMFDIRLRRESASAGDQNVTLSFVVNGARSSLAAQIKETELLIQGHTIPIDKSTKKGWGRVELPADSNLSDNIWHLVFDQPVAPLSVIVSDDPETAGPTKAALSVSPEPGRKQEARVLPSSSANEIEWDKTALIVWQSPMPVEGDVLAKQLTQHVQEGRSVLFMPPLAGGGAEQKFMGVSFGAWKPLERKKEQTSDVEWWRATDGLLANARSGQPLPVGELQVSRYCPITGDSTPLARLADGEPLLAQATDGTAGLVAFLGTTPGSSGSSLARDGVVWYAVLQRALAEGAKSLGNAQQREAGAKALAPDVVWKPMEDGVTAVVQSLRAGVLTAGDRSVALNRPLREDVTSILSDDSLKELFNGLQFHRVDDSVDSGRDLANEIWRTFLLLMALAIILEAVLCLPRKQTVKPEQREVMA
ncbi:MAG: BatA domain-containing protein [Verrucomicrobiaceae bacterium]|nr:BatA domain-containing protein [Verrucomicrobiaceae bacterium]